MAGIDQGKRMAGGSTILKMAKSNLKETTKTENGMDWKPGGIKMVLNDQRACIIMVRKRGNGFTGTNRGTWSIMYVFKQISVQLL